MDREIAIQILEIAMRCSHAADQSVEVAMQDLEEDQFPTYRRHAGLIMASIFDNLMVPVYEEHPDLAPDWYREMNAERDREPSGGRPQ